MEKKVRNEIFFRSPVSKKNNFTEKILATFLLVIVSKFVVQDLIFSDINFSEEKGGNKTTNKYYFGTKFIRSNGRLANSVGFATPLVLQR